VLPRKIHRVPRKVTPKYKSQQLRQILSKLNILLATLIMVFLAQTLQISTKSIAQFLSNRVPLLNSCAVDFVESLHQKGDY